jgi:hypothetical protein
MIHPTNMTLPVMMGELRDILGEYAAVALAFAVVPVLVSNCW